VKKWAKESNSLLDDDSDKSVKPMNKSRWATSGQKSGGGASQLEYQGWQKEQE
jgi:hypothetical protein